MIESYIQTRISTPIESVLIKEALDEGTIDKINLLNNPALFFIVNNLYVNPAKVETGPTLASNLSSILGISQSDIESTFVIKKRRHLEILRKMDVITRDIVKKRIDSEK
jgi:hypothetical protein